MPNKCQFNSKFHYKNMRIFAQSFQLWYNAQSVPVILEHSHFFPSVFTSIHILFKVLQKFLKKKAFFRYTLFFNLLVGTELNVAAQGEALSQHPLTTCRSKQITSRATHQLDKLLNFRAEV